jgi:hypothetical protein
MSLDVQAENMAGCFMSADDIHDAIGANRCQFVVTALSSSAPFTKGSARWPLQLCGAPTWYRLQKER